ncbi:YaaA family protein [Fusibacter bizertensis]
MIFLLSPSKTMNIKVVENIKTSPVLLSSRTTVQLRRTLQNLTTVELKKLYKVSEKIIESAQSLNAEKYAARSIELFEGLVFKNLDYKTLQPREKQYVNDHLLIFSALYGIVSPEQVIMPYRLDLNNHINGKIEDLTSIWQKKITDYLIKHDANWVVNLASEEYSKLVDIKLLKKRKNYINIEFMEYKDDKLVKVATYAKMARGKFMREISKLNVFEPELLKEICVMDYIFSSQYSSEENFVYIR